MNISPNDLAYPIGQQPGRPFCVFGNINSNSFGDYVSSLFFINSVANLFDYSRITLAYRTNVGFKAKLTSLLPNAIVLPLAPGSLPSLDLFDTTADKAAMSALKPWFDAGLEHQDFIMSDSMIWAPALNGFENPAHLRIPADQVEMLSAQLRTCGVAPDKWYCCIHYREPGYKYKPSGRNFRDSDPRNYLAVANYIIDKLGGQVVRLGHVGMTPFPARQGFVDLSFLDDSEMLQAFAVSRSRFVLAGPSGMTALSTALNVPLGHTDAVDFWAGVHPHDALRTIDVITPTGEVLNQRALRDSGLGKLELTKKIHKGEDYKILKNSPEILARMADYLYETTTAIVGWREPQTPAPHQRPNHLVWPRVPNPRFHFLET